MDNNGIKYNNLKIVGAVICGLVGIAQILLIIFNHAMFHDGVWYFVAFIWLAAAALLVLMFFKKKKAYLAYRKEIEEQEALLMERYKKLKKKKKATK